MEKIIYNANQPKFSDSDYFINSDVFKTKNSNPKKYQTSEKSSNTFNPKHLENRTAVTIKDEELHKPEENAVEKECFKYVEKKLAKHLKNNPDFFEKIQNKRAEEILLNPKNIERELFGWTAGVLASLGSDVGNAILKLQHTREEMEGISKQINNANIGIGAELQTLAVADMAIAAADFVNFKAVKNKALRQLFAHLDGANNFINHPDEATAKDAESYLQFMQNVEKIPKLNKMAALLRKQVYVASIRDLILQSGKLGIGITVIAGTSVPFAGDALGVLSGPLQIAQGVNQVKAARQDQKHARNAARQSRQLFENIHETLEGVDQERYALLDKTIQSTFHQAQKKAKTQELLSMSRIGYGSLNIGVGLPSIGINAAIAAGALAAAGTAASTAGISLIVIGSVGAAMFCACQAYKMHKQHATEHKEKWLQRTAHTFISNSTPEELENLYLQENGFAEVIPVNRNHYSKKTGTKQKLIDLQKNPYVALHLIASDFINTLFDNSEEGVAKAERTKAILLGIGMPTNAIRALEKIVRNGIEELADDLFPDYADLLNLVKSHTAPHMSLKFRLNKKGLQAAAENNRFALAFNIGLLAHIRPKDIHLSGNPEEGESITNDDNYSFDYEYWNPRRA